MPKFCWACAEIGVKLSPSTLIKRVGVSLAVYGPCANLRPSDAAVGVAELSNSYEQQQMHMIKANENIPIRLAVD